MSPASRRHAAVMGAAALLRTAGALYLGAWVGAALAPPGDPLRGAVAAALAAAGPALLTLVLRSMLAGRGWGLPAVPFMVVALVGGAAIAAADAAGVPPPALALGALALVCAAAALLARAAPAAPVRPAAMPRGAAARGGAG